MLRKAALAALVMLVSACATTPALKDRSATFEAHGRLSIHYRDLQSAKEDTVFGRFDWLEHGDTVDVSLLDPLGQGIATVHTSPHHAVLKMANGQVFEGDTPDGLTQEALGYSLPIAGLRFWLTGRSADGALARPDEDGGLSLKDQGWTIHYPSATLPPARIDLSYPGPGVALDIRIAIEKNDGA